MGCAARVVAKIRYDIPFQYSHYQFLKRRHERHSIMRNKIQHSIYKKNK